VTAFAPATVANVSCGFDVLGFALEAPGDEVTAAFDDTLPAGALGEMSVSGDGGRLPRDPGKNTAGVAARALVDALASEGRLPPHGIRLSLGKGMALGSGMGSSAASAAAAVTAIDALLGAGFAKERLAAFAAEGERAACGAAHADNAAPSVMGGMVLIRAYDPLDLIRLPVPEGLACALIHPHAELATADSRAVLPSSYPRPILVAHSGNLAGFVAALHSSDWNLLSRCLRDYVAEPYRAALIPAFRQIKHAAMGAGALGCGISGSGPSVFALARGIDAARACAGAMAKAYAAAGIRAESFVSPLRGTGARLVASATTEP